ncbi:activated protein kinase catalytic subunit alpha-1 [Seminavis robusta]|uniref:Activated protein kinase catalytic subunit alpha-1 n=1 Tax=Seminavis robusta TaxID=568900 RepID=A0A9N8D7S7_9STRA|nr:activated protein kinase catalytic subunit alpha-1 [Seminavis robusta]|eukprot:Sro32_g020770.1 activated protein kinase catalytic subunit alpha-1 (467) ;mRNA; r:63404-64929
MQFHFNSDYPGLTAEAVSLGLDVGVAEAKVFASDPREFPPAQPIPCARITTRIYRPDRNEVKTVQNVLVRIMPRPQQPSNSIGDNSSMSSDDLSVSSSTSSTTTMSDMYMEEAVDGGPMMSGQSQTPVDETHEYRAYWIQRTLREAIYGRVLFATVLRRRSSHHTNDNNADWEVTSEFCAIKEMSQQLIRKEKDRLAEDPIKEVSAMQYLKQWHESHNGNSTTGGMEASNHSVMDTHIMMPLDLLSDDINLYSIMPYCDGGELFERLDTNERFSEDEARYWMHQLLSGLESLQRAGICHRDISLENLLVHQNKALVIDLGMCLRVPLSDKNSSLTNSNAHGSTFVIDGKVQSRSLLRPQGTCGKWIYMSPEIYSNKEPFDGYAVDLWAAGVILFLMLTGFPPWECACTTDLRFKYMTGGYLVQMLTEWELGLSCDAMDLLQRMLFLDPKDRLSLDQVRAHPWMLTG